MRSIFRYPGGKSKRHVVQWIVSYVPSNIQEYREPFVGGGGVFFGVHADRFGRRWINDKHSGLIEVYRALQDRPEDFISKCTSVLPATEGEELSHTGPRGGRPVCKRLKDVFESVKLNEECDQAFRYYFVNRTVHGSGRVNYDIPSRLYFSNPEGWAVVHSGILSDAARHLDGVKVTCGDYRPLLRGDSNVWVYCDPPYVVNSNLTATSQLYQHSFTIECHEAFALECRESNCRIAISYDDDSEGIVRELFRGFEIQEAQWKYSGSSLKSKKDGLELLILNYKPNSLVVSAPTLPQVNSLSDSEEQLLSEAEAHIDAGLRSFRDAGAWLMKIRDRRLYRKTHATFQEYCIERWEMKRRMVDCLIVASKVVDAIENNLSAMALKPKTERQCRPLATVLSTFGEAAVATAWEQVVSRTNGWRPFDWTD